MERDKILEALHTIQDVCKEQAESADMCGNCPFGAGGGECKIVDKTPNVWDISSTEVWRAFK